METLSHPPINWCPGRQQLPGYGEWDMPVASWGQPCQLGPLPNPRSLPESFAPQTPPEVSQTLLLPRLLLWCCMKSRRAHDTMQALLPSTENIPELPTLIPAQIHNSPIPAVWWNLTLAQPKPTHYGLFRTQELVSILAKRCMGIEKVFFLLDRIFPQIFEMK